MDIRSLTSNVQSGVLIADKISTPTPQPVVNTAGTAPATNNPVAPVAKRPSAEEVNRAVSELNKAVQSFSQNLEFSVDTDAREVIVKVVDQQTKQVLRQIPSIEAVEIAKSLDKFQGLLIKQEA